MIKKLKEVSDPSPYRIWYNDWVEKHAKGNVLDVGKSRYWDYGFPTIDTNKKLNPTIVQDICNCNLPDGTYDMVLCNGMYECVSEPKKMVDEVMRILKPKGVAIFGFVGKDYKPYKKDWKFYDKNIDFSKWGKSYKDFNNEYNFIICLK
jgi:SAM-dependent methyltransferase